MSLKISSLVVFSMLFTLCCFAQEPPTITTCGEQHICITDTTYNLCVEITVDTAFTATIDSFIIDWGDNSTTRLMGSHMPSQQFHLYDLSSFFNTCVFDSDYDIGLLTYLANSPDPLFNASKVWFRNPPQAEFSFVQDTICAGDLAMMINDSCPEDLLTVSWNYEPGAYGEADSYVYDTVGTYTVGLWVESPCGRDSTFRNLVVVPPPMAEAVVLDGVETFGDTLAVCLGGGGFVILDGSNSQYANAYEWGPSSTDYSWTNPNDIIAGLNFDEPGVYDIILTVNSVCDRQAYDTLTFEVIDDQLLSLDIPEDTCLSILYTPSPLFPEATYYVNSIPHPASDFPILLGLGVHIIEAELINDCGNQYLIDSFSVTEPIEVAITFPLQDTILCRDSDPLLLQNDTIGGVWAGEHLSVEGDTVIFTPAATGQFPIIYSFGHGPCRRSDSILIQVQAPEPVISDLEVCPWSTPISLAGMPGGGHWTSVQCPTCVTQDSFIPANLQGLTSVDLIYSVADSLGCEATTTATITVHEPSAAFTLMSPFCTDSALAVDFSASVGSDFIWRLDSMESSPPPFTGVASGTHVVELVAIIGECRDSISEEIKVLLPPFPVEFELTDTEICPGVGVLFEPIGNPLAHSDSTGIINYTWSFGRSLEDTLEIYLPTDSIHFENNSDSTLHYRVSFTAENECGVAITDTVISVLPLPVAEISLDSSRVGCSPFTILFTNRSFGQLDSCHWDLGDSTYLSTCQDTFSHTYYAPDSMAHFPVQLLAINECAISTALDTIIVTPPGVDAFYNIDDADFKVCPFDTIQFEDASTPIPTSWNWNFGDGTSSTLPNPTHVFTSPEDTFTISLRVSTGCGSDLLSRQIITLSAPQVDFEVPSFGCEGSPLPGIVNLSPLGYHAYIWNFGNGLVDSTHFHPSPPPIYELGGDSVQIQLTVVDFPNFCKNTQSKNVWIREKPIAEFELSDVSNCIGYEFTASTLPQENFANQWQWTIDHVPVSENETIRNLFTEGKHKLTLIASYDGICVDSTSQTIEGVDCVLYFPNAFSPNDDGYNDYFNAYAANAAVKNIEKLVIYNRWGEVVFTRHNFMPTLGQDQDNLGWDGTFKEVALNPGVFVYLAKVELANGSFKTYAGNVTLIR